MSCRDRMDQVTVRQAMRPVTATVRETDKIEDVARHFESAGTHALPVVDEREICIGLITTFDLAGYEADLPDANSRIDHGMNFDLAHYNGGPIQIVPRPFDQVERHMTRTLQTIRADSSLTEAAQMMCHQFIHHLVVLDDREHPLGMLSPLDILGNLLNIPVPPVSE